MNVKDDIQTRWWALEEKLMQRFGIDHHLTTAYHPAANGMIERIHRTLKACLRAKLSDDNWVHELPIILFAMRTAVRPDLQGSPDQLVFGTSLRVPGCHFDPAPPDDPEVVLRRIHETFRNLAHQAPVYHGTPPQQDLPNLERCTHVFVRHETKVGLQRPYKGPFQIISRGPTSFILDLDGKEDSVAKDRLMPAYLESTEERFPSTFTRQRRAVVRRTRLISEMEKCSFCLKRPLHF